MEASPTVARNKFGFCPLSMRSIQEPLSQRDLSTAAPEIFFSVKEEHDAPPLQQKDPLCSFRQ